ncbi:hypothetical protein KNE206_61810 [Kitasatospora sp. NE20-6]
MAERGGPAAGLFAGEEPSADGAFDPVELGGEGGLAHAELPGSLAYAAGVRHRAQDTEVSDVELHDGSIASRRLPAKCMSIMGRRSVTILASRDYRPGLSPAGIIPGQHRRATIGASTDTVSRGSP